jgi:ubiquitin-like modifier-activating enzyme ATG7
LSLMRWRLLPQLDLSSIKSLRCLLFGAGTLGCNVARCLLVCGQHMDTLYLHMVQGWGVRHITFIDSGRVSLSNPVRQSLFTMAQARAGVHKAVAAADSLRAVFPGVRAYAHVLQVPMPGHLIIGVQALTKEQRVTELV